MRDFEGRTFLITGGSSGIGRACALRLASRGARLVLLGRDEGRLMTGFDPQTVASFLHCDLANPESLRAAVAGLGEKAATLHGCVLAAGANAFRPLALESSERMASLWQLNVSGSVGLIAAAVKGRLFRDGASIVLFSSAVARTGGAGLVSYSSTKGAIEAATRSMAAELARLMVRVNAVAPGVVRTPMTEQHFSKLSAEQIAALEARHPLGFGAPEDLAGAVEFLLSDDARWITGSILTVDGGFSVS